MTAADPTTMERAVQAITLALMPFFMLGAGDDPQKARDAVADLICAYGPTDVAQLDLTARIIGFSIAALDNLRLSAATPDLSVNQVVRYRSNAVSLSRTAETCRAALQQRQTEAEAARPRPAAAAVKPQPAVPPMSAQQIEKAKAEANALFTGLAKRNQSVPPGQGLTAMPQTFSSQDPIPAAIAAALSGTRTPSVLRR